MCVATLIKGQHTWYSGFYLQMELRDTAIKSENINFILC